MRIDYSRRPLPREEPAPSLHYEGNESARDCVRSWAESGQFVDSALPEGTAVTDERTDTAPGLPRRANKGAEFH